MHNCKNKIATQFVPPDIRNTFKDLGTFWLLLNISEFELCNIYLEWNFHYEKYFRHGFVYFIIRILEIFI